MSSPWLSPCALTALLLLGGCRSPSPAVVFHTLRPLALDGAQPPNSGPPVALEVLPVRIPELLQRSQIVVLRAPGSHSLSPTHRWGNSLEQDLRRVLAENLSVLLGSDEILIHPPRNPAKTSYRIELDVLQCEGEPGGSFRFRALWVVTRGTDGHRMLLRRSDFRETAEGPSMEGLVAAHDRALDKLSREIAAAVRALGAATP